MNQVRTDPVIGEYTLVRSRRARRISLRVHPEKGVIVTIPFYEPLWRVRKMLEERREWILSTRKRQAARLEKEVAEGKAVPAETDREALVAALRKEAKAVLPARLSVLAERYGFRYGRVFIKHNSSNWGSCSARGNINLNLNLMRLPEDLRDYVLLHELAHLSHPNHGPAFHALLDRLCRDCTGRPARELEKEVKSWRLV